MTAPNAPISAALAEYEDRLRGRAGPFTAEPGERYVDADIAKQVLRETVAAMAEREAALVKEVESLRADRDRLNWLDANNLPKRMGWAVRIAPAGNVSVWSVVFLGSEPVGIRGAIDAARAEAHRGKGGAA